MFCRSHGCSGGSLLFCSVGQNDCQKHPKARCSSIQHTSTSLAFFNRLLLAVSLIDGFPYLILVISRPCFLFLILILSLFPRPTNLSALSTEPSIYPDQHRRHSSSARGTSSAFLARAQRPVFCIIHTNYGPSRYTTHTRILQTWLGDHSSQTNVQSD